MSAPSPVISIQASIRHLSRAQLPTEVLEIIFRYWLQRSNTISYKLDGTAWNEDTQGILSCSRLSRGWNGFANCFLYGAIRLDSNRSIRALVRTIHDYFKGVFPVHDLVLVDPCAPDESSLLPSFRELSITLLSVSPCLRSLTLSFSTPARVPLSLNSNTPRSHIKEVTLANVAFRSIIHLLSGLNELEVLVLSGFADNAASGASFSLTPSLWPSTEQSIESIRPPTFRLRQLTLSHTILSRAELNWLLASSTSTKSVTSLTVDGVGVHVRPLAILTGLSVETLHFAHDGVGYPSSTAVRTLPIFKKLKYLQFTGRLWYWDEIYEYMHAEVETLSIPLSEAGMRCLIKRLAMGWGPKLREIIVGGSSLEPRFGKEGSLIAELMQVCTERRMRLTSGRRTSEL